MAHVEIRRGCCRSDLLLVFVVAVVGASFNSVLHPVAVVFLSLGRKENSIERAHRLLLSADAVFFDVDSTIVTTEGIDLLGRCFGVMDQIAELTREAMDGNVRFQKAMAQRLELLAKHGMTKDSFERCAATEGRPQWSPGVQELVRRLQARGTEVYLVSGGFRTMIAPVAEQLDIPDDHVYANTILFDVDGSYLSFDRDAPTSRSGGKPAVLRMLRKSKGYQVMIMIGDGATDMDARTQGPAKAFIGYGGVSVREAVKQNADWFVYNFQEILDVFPDG